MGRGKNKEERVENEMLQKTVAWVLNNQEKPSRGRETEESRAN